MSPIGGSLAGIAGAPRSPLPPAWEFSAGGGASLSRRSGGGIAYADNDGGGRIGAGGGGLADHDWPGAPSPDQCRVGDIVVDVIGDPVGVVDTIIRPASGPRLIMVVAEAERSRARYVVCPESDAVPATCQPFGGAARRALAVPREAVLASGSYRREMGRLVRDQSQVDMFRCRAGSGWRDADARTRDEIRADFERAILTTGQPVDIEVWHGVAHLHGRIATDAGVIEALYISRANAGTWHAISSLISDEALVAQMRRQVRASAVAAAVAAVGVSRGVATVTLAHGATIKPAILAAWQDAVPGLVKIRAMPPGGAARE